MIKFVTFACLLVATVNCASLPNEENLRDLTFVKANIKNAETMLSTLQSQLSTQFHDNPSFRSEDSEFGRIRQEMDNLYSELNQMREVTKILEGQLYPQRIRRDVNERQNIVVETTSTVVNSAAVGIQSTLNTLNNLMININRGVNNLFTRVTNQITNVAVTANNAAQSGVQSLNNGAQAAINNANQAATAVVNTVYSGVQGAAQGIGSAVQTGYNAVSNAATTGINAAANTVNRLTG